MLPPVWLYGKEGAARGEDEREREMKRKVVRVRGYRVSKHSYGQERLCLKGMLDQTMPESGLLPDLPIS